MGLFGRAPRVFQINPYFSCCRGRSDLQCSTFALAGPGSDRPGSGFRCRVDKNGSPDRHVFSRDAGIGHDRDSLGIVIPYPFLSQFNTTAFFEILLASLLFQ